MFLTLLLSFFLFCSTLPSVRKLSLSKFYSRWRVRSYRWTQTRGLVRVGGWKKVGRTRIESLEHRNVMFSATILSGFEISFATNCKLALTNTFSSTLLKGGISHTPNGPNHRNERMRINYLLTRQAERPKVHDVKVHPQPPPRAKANSDHNLVCASVVVSGPTAKCELPQ